MPGSPRFAVAIITPFALSGAIERGLALPESGWRYAGIAHAVVLLFLLFARIVKDTVSRGGRVAPVLGASIVAFGLLAVPVNLWRARSGTAR